MTALSKRDIEMIFRAETDSAQRPVGELSSEVKRLRQSLEDLAKTGGKTDKSLESLATTTRELEKAQDELANARTLLTQLNAQANALDRAEEKAEKAAAAYKQLKTQVDGAEQPTKRLVNSMEAAERRMNATNQRLEEQRKNYAEVKTSIESIIGPVDNLQDAFRTVAVAQREITQGMAAAKGSVSAFKAEIADTKVEADRLAQVDAFRKLAADSIAADSAADRIKAGLDGSSTSAQRLADAVQGIVNPARATAVTLDGVDERLEAVLAKMAGGRISVNEWNHLNNELESIQANLIRAAASVDAFNQQQARVGGVSAEYDKQAAKVRELATAQVNAGTNVEELTADLRREEAQLKTLGATLDRETAKLREFGTAMARVGVDANSVPVAIQRIERSAARAAPAVAKVRDVITPNGKRGFLGLDPFQLQNLSYQVNDVFTGLASGQPPFQVFAQQAGQIVQIFPGIISGFAAWLPLILPAAAALFTLGSAVSEANTQIQTLRTANTVLASLGENNGYTAARFREMVNSLRDMGVAAEDAVGAVKNLVEEGLNPKVADDFLVAAKNLQAAHPEIENVAEAMGELTKAFTGGADEVLKLDDKYKFLTTTQRENLIASKDTKDEYNEVNKAFSALYAKMQAGANAAKGPMTDATNTLRLAWRDLLKQFGMTDVIENTTRYISNAVLGLTYLINIARRAGMVFGAALKAFDAHKGQGDFVALMHAGAALSGAYAGTNGGIMASAERDTYAQMARSRQALARQQQAAGEDIGQGSRGRQRQNEARAARDRKDAERDRKKSAREAEADSKRRQREAAQLERQYQNEQDQLQSALSRFTIEALRGTQAPLEQQLEFAKQAVDEQFRAVEDRLYEFREKFGSGRLINGMSQEDFAAAIERQKAQITLAKQLGVYESNVNDLLKARDTALKSIQDDQKAGLTTAQQALDKTYEVTSRFQPAIDQAVNAARSFIAALTPSSETTALLEKLDRIQNQSGADSKNTIMRTQARSGVSQGEREINDLLERRAALVASANALYESGAYNYTQKEDAIRQAFTDTNAAIQASVVSAYEFLEANKQMLPPDVYQNALAQLRLYNDQLKYTDELTRNVKQSAQDAIANGVMSMFDSLAKGIADFVTGAGTLKNLLSNLGRAALQFAADFAMSIAKAIMQIYALRVAKSLIGGFHGGGTVGDYGGGQMKLSRSIGGPDLNLSAVPRYHEGTQGAGLKSNEMLAVLERGEKVQTEEQQAAEKRKLDNARKSGGGRGLRQVLAFGDQEVAGAMAGPAGEEVVVTHIRRNRTRLRQELGIA